MPSVLTIDKERCKGCGVCLHFCPKKVLEINDELNKKGYYPAYQARPELCIFCGACFLMCPDVAISITVDDTKRKKEINDKGKPHGKNVDERE